MDRPAEFRSPVRRVVLYAEAMRLYSRRDWRRGGWALGAGLDLRFCRGVLRSVLACGLWFCCRVLSSVHACCLCVPAGIVCSFALSGRGAGLRGDARSVVAFALHSRSAMRVLSPRLGFGLRSAMRFCCRVCPRFSPAVCSSVGAVCARCALAVCASLSALCVRLSCRDAELVCAAMRFCCRVLSSVYARRCGSVGALCLGSRLSFFLCQEKRDGLRCLAFLFRRVEIAIRAFSRHSSVICLGWFTSGLCVSLWRSRRVTGDTGLRGNGTGGAALVRFCATALAL